MPAAILNSSTACRAVATAAVVVAYAAALEAWGFGGATGLAVAAAAFLSGIAGFSFSAICGAMLFQFRHDPVEVVQIMLVCSIGNQALSVWALRREIRVGALVPYLAGAAAGLPAGVWVLTRVDARTLTAGLGAGLVLIGLVLLVRRPAGVRRGSRAGAVLAGALGGVLGGVAAIPSIPVMLWCESTGMGKAARRAVYQPFVLVNQLVALGLTAGLHHGAASVPVVAWAVVPVSLAGAVWGLACYRRLSGRHFALCSRVTMIAAGVGLAA